MRVHATIFVILFGFSIFSSFLHAIDQDAQKTLLAVVIMIKNEADVIIPTLRPFVDAGITHYLVFDTGSTDGTQQKVRDYFNQSGIDHAYIVEEPFIDFATSRNRALELAEQILVGSTFLVMLDAEWYTHNVEELINFCKIHETYIHPHCTGSCYLMRLFTVQDCINNYTPRLIRRGYNVRYVGGVHEVIIDNPSGLVPDSVYFEYAPREYGQEKSKARCARDYELLKKDYDKDSTNTRALFYLGQTCQFLNDWEQAIFYYEKRLALGELSEEKYLAAYRIGCAIEYILETTKNNDVVQKYTWKDALHYYLKAHAMLPYRAEPLFRIACYYIRNNEHAVAYLFAIRAVQLPYPQNNGLFIESRIYNHFRYDILGQCAIYAGECEIGKAAILKAMEVAPDDPHLHHNLALYNQYIV